MKNATPRRTQTRGGNTLTGMTITNGNLCLPIAQRGITIENGILRFPVAQLWNMFESRVGSATGGYGVTSDGTVKRRGRPAGSSNKAKTRTAGSSA
jgi:hypothetical protein